MRKAALELVTTTRKSHIQATRLIGGFLGPYMRVNLSDLRDLVAATEDYDARSEVRIESTSVSVIETESSGYWERGRDTTTEGSEQ